MQYLLAMLLLASEPPAIRREGVLNAASQRPPSAGGRIAPGSVITIRGVRFATKDSENVVTLRSANGTATQLPVLASSWADLEAWIPPGVPPGPATITVSANGSVSEPIAVVLQAAALGLFSSNGEGWGPSALGDSRSLLVNGVTAAPDVIVGGKPAKALSLRAQPGHRSRLDFELSPDTPAGCFVPVYIRAKGSVSNAVTIAVRRSPAECREESRRWSSGTVGVLVVTRTLRTDLETREERVRDEASALFVKMKPDSPPSNPNVLNPPLGVCTTFAGQLDPRSPTSDAISGMLVNAKDSELLSAGSTVAINDGRKRVHLSPVASGGGFYKRELSGRNSTLRLDTGHFSIAGQGGPGVGPFTMNFPAPEPFSMPETMRHRIIDRHGPLRLEWDSKSPDAMRIRVMSSAGTGSAGITYCMVPAAAQRFTIPRELLAHLPQGRGLVTLLTSVRGTAASIPKGLDSVHAFSVFAREIEVMVR